MYLEQKLRALSKLTFKKNKLAIAVKDGSSLEIDDFNLLENQYDFAVFNKKSEYGKSVLKLTNTTDLENLNFLVGKNNELIANSKLNIKKLENSYIYNLFYNNIN